MNQTKYSYVKKCLNTIESGEGFIFDKQSIILLKDLVQTRWAGVNLLKYTFTTRFKESNCSMLLQTRYYIEKIIFIIYTTVYNLLTLLDTSSKNLLIFAQNARFRVNSKSILIPIIVKVYFKQYNFDCII